MASRIPLECLPAPKTAKKSQEMRKKPPGPRAPRQPRPAGAPAPPHRRGCRAVPAPRTRPQRIACAPPQILPLLATPHLRAVRARRGVEEEL